MKILRPCPTTASPGVRNREELLEKRFVNVAFIYWYEFVNWPTKQKLQQLELKGREITELKEVLGSPNCYSLEAGWENYSAAMQASFYFFWKKDDWEERARHLEGIAKTTVSSFQAAVGSPNQGTDHVWQDGFQNCYKPENAVCFHLSPSWMRVHRGYPVLILLLYLGCVGGGGGRA